MDDRRIPDLPEALLGQQRKFVDRRKRKDWVVRSVTIVAALGWILALTALLLIDRASPAQEDFITRFLNVSVVSYWDTALLRGAFAAIIASFIICVVGLILNATRQRRKTDRYNKLLIALSIASVVMLVLYLVFFSGYL